MLKDGDAARKKAADCMTLAAKASSEVFFANGRLSVKEQAELLGLCRSTAHAVLQCSYKKSGLSAAIIKRMLACPRLPEKARTIILEYIAERIGGLYGHTPKT